MKKRCSIGVLMCVAVFGVVMSAQERQTPPAGAGGGLVAHWKLSPRAASAALH